MRSEGGPLLVSAPGPAGVEGTLNGTSLTNVAGEVGLSFRQGAFQFGMSSDVTAMMGGGVCWLDYDDDGWLDLFVVNSYAQADASAWESGADCPAARSSETSEEGSGT